jgi:hypothetical protein
VKLVPFERRIPRRGERVFSQGKEGLFAVLKVHNDSKTADLKLIGRTGIVLKSIRWETLSLRPPLPDFLTKRPCPFGGNARLRAGSRETHEPYVVAR